MVYVFDLSICLPRKIKDSVHFNIRKPLTVFVFKCFEHNFIVFIVTEWETLVDILENSVRISVCTQYQLSKQY